jgi:large repetitive protein
MTRILLWLLLTGLCVSVFAQDDNLRIETSTLSPAVVGTAYSQDLEGRGGDRPYTWNISTGVLPIGLTINANTGRIEGIPVAMGVSNFEVQVTDDDGRTARRSFSLTVSLPVVAVSISTNSPLPSGSVNTSYSLSFTAAGGVLPYSWSIDTGTPPPGLTLGTGGALTGTPTTPGQFTFTVRVRDALLGSASKPFQLSIFGITTLSLPGGTIGVAYSQTLTAAGGAGAITWSVVSGTLPAGLSLNPSTGAITGTPTAVTSAPFTVRAADAGGGSATAQFSINVLAPPITITTNSLPDGTVGTVYSQTLTATGGVGAITWSVSSGTLPAGLSLSSAGAITGTPTTAGTPQFTVRAADTASGSATKALTITIKATPVVISTASLPGGTVGTAYSQSLAASGGTTPYNWTIASGSLPAGLSLGGAGSITGTPTTAGNSSFTVRATDAGNQTADKPFTIAVVNPVSITTSQLVNATAGTAYSASLAASGGTPPYTFTVSAGSLPPGLTMNPGGQISGTPTAAGNSSFTVRAADNAGRSSEKALTLNVLEALRLPACPAPAGTVGAAYSATLQATGGQPPYTFALTAGDLPAGLALAASGAISGTPTASGAFNFSLRASDATGSQATATCVITIRPALTVALTQVPDATAQVAYVHTLQANGGLPPYTWSAGGTLPPGLSLDPGSGQISGTPTAPGEYNLIAVARDAAGAQAQRAIVIRVATGLVISACPVPVATVGQTYTGLPTTAGGEAPIAWAVTAGSLPSGLSLDASNGNIGGAPQASGTAQFTLRATDARGASAMRACSIDVADPLTISTTELKTASIGSAFTDAIVVRGGTGPYTYSTSSGVLPPGVLLSATTGQISGTPTDAGAFRFTVRVSDVRGAGAEREFTLNVAAGLVIPACPAPVAVTGQSYSSPVQASLGRPPYTWAIGTGTLPAGVSLNPQSGIVSGTPSQAGTAEFTLRVTDAASATATRACSVIVNDALLSITTATVLPEAIAGVGYSFEFRVAGGRAPYVWTIVDGALPAGLRMDANGAVSGTASATGPFTMTIRVTDSNQSVTSQQVRLNVLPAAAPSVSYVELPEIAGPGQQVRVALRLDSPYPLPLQGEVRMSFAPDPGIDIDDSSIQFATGGRRVSFGVGAGETSAAFPIPELMLQTGTVAGTIQLAVELSSNGQALGAAATKSLRIDRLAPRITSVRVTSTAAGFEVRVAGFSTTREVSQATFRFTPAAGSALEASEVVVPMTDAARSWFSDTRSHMFGSQFVLTQPFTLQNARLTSVTVSLTNGQGTSQGVSGQF